MNTNFRFSNRFIMSAVTSAFLLGTTSLIATHGISQGIAQEIPIIHPGAPGEASQELSADQAIEIANNSYSPDDAKFMQDMIPHHNQAVQMAALVADRTNLEATLDVAGRIDASQLDEIAFMQQWLEERGEDVPDPTAHHGMHTSHMMAGMASPEQMEELAQSSGTDFDRLFLSLMIRHHEGAVTMVEKLLDQPGSAYDPILFEFTNDVTNDQKAEIKRMNSVLIGLSNDPRAELTPGFENAGQASLNMQLLATLPKPPGFYDPENPAGIPPLKPQKEEEDATSEEAEEIGEDAEESEPEASKRSPLLSLDRKSVV